MNLVQTQYHLRDLPDAQVKAFADGRDPATVPEWLATAEMQRRQRMETASNKAPEKSVKERLEETMGLKALQAQRQQQAAQKMGEQAMGLPTIPENVPQPEEQPQVQEAAAGGLMRGIAQLPVEMFHQAAYAGGGIVAFEGGGGVPKNSAGIPVLPAPADPAYEELMKRLREQETPIETPEDIIAKRKALLEQQGVRPAGEGQERRIQERGVAYEQEKKDRALNNLIASMSSFGRPNISGKGQGSDYANTAVRGFEAARAEDRQFQDAQDKLQDAIEAQRRAELVGNVDMAQKAIEDQKKAKAEMARAKLTASGQAAQIATTSQGQGLQYLSEQERANIQREGNRIQAAQLAKDPDAIRGARALMKDAKEAGKDLTLEQALVIYGQASSGYQSKELTEERARLEKADKQFNELYGTQVKIANFEKDPAKKQKMLDELEVKRKEIYKKYKVAGEDGVSSDQGGSSSGGTSSAGWGQATKVTK
jgi:hypothetical protein